MTERIEAKTAQIMKLMVEFSEIQTNVRDSTAKIAMIKMIAKDVEQAFEDLHGHAFDRGAASVNDWKTE